MCDKKVHFNAKCYKLHKTIGKERLPGIFLEADFFGYRQRQNDQQRSQSDGELTVRVPVRLLTHCTKHCSKKGWK